MTPQQFLLILRARLKLAVILLLLTISVVTIVSLLLPKRYTASTSIVFDLKSDPILGVVLPAVASPGYVTTQTDIIQSDRVAGRVVKLLRFEQSPTAVDTWKQETESKISLESYYGTLLQKGLSIKPTRGSNVLNITYTGAEPKFTAAVANAFAQAYIETNIELRVDPARQYAAWFDERLKTLRDNLEQAQARLSAYQQEKGIVATDERVDQETARLSALTTQLASTQAERADMSSRQKNTGSELSPDVMQSAVVQGIKAELAKAEARLSEISSTVGKNHPQRQQLEAQIAGLKQQISEEIRRVSGGIATASRVTSQKVEEARAAYEAQKKHVLNLRAERDQISVLVKEVEAAQRAYESVSLRMSQNSLESQSQQTNVSILSPAVEPTEASHPKIMLNILASVLGGGLLGIGVALGLEMLDRRVRNQDDLAALEGIPVLGVLQPEAVVRTFKERLAHVMTYIRRRRRHTTQVAPA